MKEREKDAISTRQWKRRQYKKELARSIYMRHRMNPPTTGDELEYTGRAKDFFVVLDKLIYSQKYLPHSEAMTWLAIFSHNKDCNPTYRVSWPGRERLAIILGKSVGQVSRYLRGLKEKKLLLMQQRPNKTALYLLNDPPKEWMEETLKELEEKK